MRVADFDFNLPPERIATSPVSPRDSARLLHVRSEGLKDHHVRDLPELLREGDLLVLNDTKVIPARLYGMRGTSKVEIFLHKQQTEDDCQGIAGKDSNKRKGIPLPLREGLGEGCIEKCDLSTGALAKVEARETFLQRISSTSCNSYTPPLTPPSRGGGSSCASSTSCPYTSKNSWLVFARPGKKLRVGDVIVFADDFSAEVLDKRESGEIALRFSVTGADFFACLHTHGHVPLPPYIKRSDTLEDRTCYQTVYAAREGAVAAPTAGLHFTPELFARLEAKGIERAFVTLHVGAGTFLPVKTEMVRDHVMHAEWGEISPAAVQKLNEAKRQGRRIVAVGTTAFRLLETAADNHGFVRPFAGETAIFITPGSPIQCVDALLTNFHLPKSTLFMLVCAFAGTGRMRAAYAHAIQNEYRFYSYGDATLLERGA